jgi:hypothetical protein
MSFPLFLSKHSYFLAPAIKNRASVTPSIKHLEVNSVNIYMLKYSNKCQGI